jgi:hypothetical protein
MGAVLQLSVQNAWLPLAFFSKKLNPGQQKYSAHDNELLAIYKAVKQFAICWKRATSSARPCRPIHYRHTTHLWTGNVVADALSRVESVTVSTDRAKQAYMLNETNRGTTTSTPRST